MSDGLTDHVTCRDCQAATVFPRGWGLSYMHDCGPNGDGHWTALHPRDAEIAAQLPDETLAAIGLTPEEISALRVELERLA